MHNLSQVQWADIEEAVYQWQQHGEMLTSEWAREQPPTDLPRYVSGETGVGRSVPASKRDTTRGQQGRQAAGDNAREQRQWLKRRAIRLIAQRNASRQGGER